ncbi:MAG: DUF3164 family protein [Bacteroidales bacterium]|nr:DUF3164 family protein [Bacteroidales bacterium]MDD3201960.1 DUF3164 family protein [Bacteroidales bacterium]
MDINQLTPKEKAELQAQLAAEAKAEAEKRAANINTYKELVSDTVIKCFPVLQDQAQSLGSTKLQIYKMFESALLMKFDLYKVKEDQQSHTFTDKDGQFRITLGANMLDNYDDTADSGIEMVKDYLNSLGDTENAKQAIKICLSLLAKDKKGTLKASRIMTLRKHAIESGNPRFIEGVEVIMNAYKPIVSKQYIRAEYKDEKGVWVSVPLGLTEADI